MPVTTPVTTIAVSDLVDRAPLKGYLGRVPLLCALLMLTEGIDTFGVGFIGPFLSAQYGISTGQLATVYTGTVVASLIGAVVLAPLSDRVGRRPLLIATSLIMGPCTLLTALADSLPLLFALRFLIGIAFGAALPVAIAMVADYAPSRRKALLLMLMNTGINLGMILAGFGAALLIPAFGWQSLLYVSGAMSLAATALVWFLLPESLQFLARRGEDGAQGLAIAARIDPTLRQLGEVRLAPDRQGAAASGSPLALLRERRWPQTLMLWFLMSLCYVLINFVAYWLPTAMMAEGATISQAGMLISTGKMGGVALALCVGWLADRLGLPWMLSVSFGVTAAATLLIGLTASVPIVATGFLLLACFMMNSNTSGTQALMVGAYPAPLRGTATGWVSGLARLVGGGAGTLVGGQMIALGWRADRIAPVFATVLFLACLTVLALRGMRPMPRDDSAAAPSAAIGG